MNVDSFCYINTFDLFQELYAAHTIHTKGCIYPLMVIFKDNLIIIGLIAFGVGFVEVSNISVTCVLSILHI